MDFPLIDEFEDQLPAFEMPREDAPDPALMVFGNLPEVPAPPAEMPVAPDMNMPMPEGSMMSEGMMAPPEAGDAMPAVAMTEALPDSMGEMPPGTMPREA